MPAITKSNQVSSSSNNSDSKSELVNSEKETMSVESPEYTGEEMLHNSLIWSRMFVAQQDRDQKHPEFNNQTYIENYESNERIANTFIAGKKFAGDVEIASGTVEQKLFAVLSEINRLSLTPEVLAYNKESEELVSLGVAMTDILFETSERESDEEKKLERQLELLKQGTVYVQELWVKVYKTEKGKVPKNKVGKINGVDWTSKIVLAHEGPERQVLYGPGVFLGNIREPDKKKQPFVFTHKLTSFEEAKSRYGNKEKDGSDVWDRWKYVPKVRTKVAGNVSDIQNAQNNAFSWTMSTVGKNMIEEVHYQDPFNNEYQIYLNGVPMLPVGFPLSAISPGGEINIDWQIYQSINPFFAFGRSFIARVKESSDILDELLRLLILKTRKSIHPPYANVSGRVISPKVLMPGRITMGLDANSLQPIGNESQGATQSEYQMYKILQESIDENTVSKQFSGQQGKSGTTAFEVGVLQSQAQKLLGLTIFSCSMLEMKLGYARLFNVLENYFEPLDTRFNRATNKIDNVFKVNTRKTKLGAQGEGTRQIIPTETLPSSRQVREEELFVGTPNVAEGQKPKTRQKMDMEPMKRIYLNPKQLKKVRIFWFIQIDTKPKETNNAEKLLFREELADLAMLMKMGSTPNIKELESRHALVWNRPKDKLFKSQIQPSMVAPQLQKLAQDSGGGRAPGADIPVTNPPSAEALQA